MFPLWRLFSSPPPSSQPNDRVSPVSECSRSILIIVWHLLADPNLRYHDLGAGFYDTRINAERAKRNHVHQLKALGYKVTVQPAA
jgi:hypothetical protein